MPDTHRTIQPGEQSSSHAGANDDVDPEDVESDPIEVDDGYPDWLDDDDDEDDDEPTVHVQAVAQWGDQRGRIDVEMAPLVTEIWHAGLETISSCQDLGESLADLGERHPHMAAYVEARRGRALIDLSPPDAQPLLEMITGGNPSAGLYDRMTRWTAEGAWRYGLVMLDLPDDAGSYSFRILAIQIELPRSDIGEATRCLQYQNSLLDSISSGRAGKRRR